VCSSDLTSSRILKARSTDGVRASVSARPTGFDFGLRDDVVSGRVLDRVLLETMRRPSYFSASSPIGTCNSQDASDLRRGVYSISASDCLFRILTIYLRSLNSMGVLSFN